MSKDLGVKVGINPLTILLLALLITGFAASTTAFSQTSVPEKYDITTEESTEQVSEVYQYEQLSEYDQSKVDEITESGSMTVRNPPADSIVSEVSGNSVSVVQENGEEVRFYVENTSPIPLFAVVSIVLGIVTLGFAGHISYSREEPLTVVTTAILMAAIYLI